MTATPKHKYAGIRTAAELEAAIREAQVARKKMDKTVEKEIHGLQQNLRPARLVTTALRQVSPYFAWGEIGLGIVRGLRFLLRPRRKK